MKIQAMVFWVVMLCKDVVTSMVLLNGSYTIPIQICITTQKTLTQIKLHNQYQISEFILFV